MFNYLKSFIINSNIFYYFSIGFLPNYRRWSYLLIYMTFARNLYT